MTAASAIAHRHRRRRIRRLDVRGRLRAGSAPGALPRDAHRVRRHRHGGRGRSHAAGAARLQRAARARRGALHARDAGHVQARHRIPRLGSARVTATFIPSARSASCGVAWSSSISGCAHAARDWIRRRSRNFPWRCAPAGATPSIFRARAPCSRRSTATPITSMPGLYADFLRRWSLGRGVTRVEGQVVDVALSAQGDIETLTLKSGQRISGDFFVDCSGFRSLLLGDKLQVPWEDWSAVAALRSCLGRALRTNRRLHALHALDRAEGRLDLAHSAATPHRQRPRVLDALRERRRGARHVVRRSRRPRAG